MLYYVYFDSPFDSSDSRTDSSGSLACPGREESAIFKFIRHFFKQLPDGQVLRTGLLAPAAFDALTGFPVACMRSIEVIPHLTGKSAGCPHDTVVYGEILRYRYVFRAVMGAVSACCTWDRRIRIDDLNYLLDDLLFFLAERFQIRKGCTVIQHLHPINS